MENFYSNTEINQRELEFKSTGNTFDLSSEDNNKKLLLGFMKNRKKMKIKSAFDRKGVKEFLASKDKALEKIELNDEILQPEDIKEKKNKSRSNSNNKSPTKEKKAEKIDKNVNMSKEKRALSSKSAKTEKVFKDKKKNKCSKFKNAIDIEKTTPGNNNSIRRISLFFENISFIKNNENEDNSSGFEILDHLDCNNNCVNKGEIKKIYTFSVGKKKKSKSKKKKK